jgi:integrase
MRHKELVRQATDHEVCQAINALRNNIPWRTILARMILWGLRPHEAFKGMVLADGGYQVSDDTKTGTRRVYSPEVVDRPDLYEWAQGPLPRVKLDGVENREIGHRVNRQFKNSGVPCNPYSLRHRFVIRLEMARVPSNIAAKLEGHSERVRSESYMATFQSIHAQQFATECGWTLNNIDTISNLTSNEQRHERATAAA